MKPLLVTLDYPPTLGGVAEYYRALAAHWPGDLAVLAPSAHDPLLGRFWPRWLPMVRTILRRARRENSDLLMAGQVLPVGTAVALSARRLKIPYIVFTHGMDVAGAWESKQKRIIAQWVLRNARLVVANSEFTKTIVKRFGVREKNIVIVNPCPDFPAIHRGSTSVRAEVEPRQILLTVARLIPRKGVDIVLRALPFVWADFPDLEYRIIGNGPEEARLRAIAKAIDPVSARVKFLGPKAHHELPEYYQSCAIFAQTSRESAHGDVEGFGLVYLEANMFGKPVVAARTGGVAEAVQDDVSGILAPPDDTQATAEAILTLLRDPARATRLGEQGRQRVAGEFQWENQIEKIVANLHL